MRKTVTQNSISIMLGDFKGGFTLLEVIMTVTIALMVITLCFSTLYYGARGSRDTQIKINVDFDIMKVYAQLRQQLINLYVSPYQESSLKGERGLEDHRDSIYFYTTSPVTGKGVVEAVYNIKTIDEKPTAVYREYPFPLPLTLQENILSTDFRDVQWIKVSDAIYGLGFTYLKGEQKFLEWLEKEPPERIEVDLWYKAGNFVDNFSFSVSPAINLPIK